LADDIVNADICDERFPCVDETMGTEP
jgi:hypothetical protein